MTMSNEQITKSEAATRPLATPVELRKWASGRPAVREEYITTTYSSDRRRELKPANVPFLLQNTTNRSMNSSQKIVMEAICAMRECDQSNTRITPISALTSPTMKK